MFAKQLTLRSILASVALCSFSALGFIACAAPVDSEGAESEGAQVSVDGEKEKTAEAQEALGQACGYFNNWACGRGETCCGGFYGICTDLQNDESNCGQCGHVCQPHSWGGPAWCYNGQCI